MRKQLPSSQHLKCGKQDYKSSTGSTWLALPPEAPPDVHAPTCGLIPPYQAVWNAPGPPQPPQSPQAECVRVGQHAQHATPE